MKQKNAHTPRVVRGSVSPESGGLLLICPLEASLTSPCSWACGMGLGILIKGLCLHFWLTTLHKQNDYLNTPFLLEGAAGAQDACGVSIYSGLSFS